MSEFHWPAGAAAVSAALAASGRPTRRRSANPRALRRAAGGDGSDYVRPLLHGIVARPHGLRELATVLPPQKAGIGEAVLSAVMLGIQKGSDDTPAFIHDMLLPQLTGNAALRGRISVDQAVSIGDALRDMPEDFAAFAARMPAAIASSLVASAESWLTTTDRGAPPLARAILAAANRAELPGVAVEDLALRAAELGETPALWRACRPRFCGAARQPRRLLGVAAVRPPRRTSRAAREGQRGCAPAVRLRLASTRRARRASRRMHARTHSLHATLDRRRLAGGRATGSDRKRSGTGLGMERRRRRSRRGIRHRGAASVDDVLGTHRRLGVRCRSAGADRGLVIPRPHRAGTGCVRAGSRACECCRTEAARRGSSTCSSRSHPSIAGRKSRSSVRGTRSSTIAPALPRWRASMRRCAKMASRRSTACARPSQESWRGTPSITERAAWLVRVSADRNTTAPSTRRLIESHFLSKELSRIETHRWSDFLSEAGDDVFAHGYVLLTVAYYLKVSNADEDAVRSFQRRCRNRDRFDALAVLSGASRNIMETVAVWGSKGMDRLRGEGRL